MKAILFVAVFVLAATARVNLTAFNAGFVDQLHLNGSQAQNAQKCQTGIQVAINDIAKLANATNPEAFALAALNLYNDVKTRIQVDCVAYANDINRLVHTNAANNTALEALVERNLQKFAPQVIQQVFVLIDAITSGNDYQAGTTEAYILQILLGLEVPAVLPVREFNYTKYVPLNQQRLFAETYRTYFTKIGMDAASVNTTLQCLNILPNISQNTAVNLFNLSNLNTVEQKLEASKNVYARFVTDIIPCVSAFKAGWNFAAPLRNNFLRSPLLFTYVLIHNIGINAPKVQQLAVNQSVSLLQGEYVEAGNLMAQLYKIYYANLQ